ICPPFSLFGSSKRWMISSLFALSLVLSTMTGVPALAGASVTHEAPASIMAIQLESDGQSLVIQLEKGAFDPLLKVEETPQGYRLIIEGQNVSLAPDVQRDINLLSKQITQQIPEVKSVTISESTSTLSGQNDVPTVKLVFELRQKLQP